MTDPLADLPTASELELPQRGDGWDAVEIERKLQRYAYLLPALLRERERLQKRERLQPYDRDGNVITQAVANGLMADFDALRIENERLVLGSLAVRKERYALRAENEGLRSALIFIAQQGCEREEDSYCPSTGDCITEWCLPCYANAHVSHTDADEG